jgi:hypothetical protein
MNAVTQAVIVSIVLTCAAGAQESPKTEVQKTKPATGVAAPKPQPPQPDAQAAKGGVPDNLKLLIPFGRR